MTALGSEDLAGMIVAIARRISDERERLNRLDAALGDGDHGTSVSAAFALATENIEAMQDASPGDIWLATAKALLNGMGGASGALFGTLFLKGVAGIRGKSQLEKAEMDQLWRAGVDGVKARGKADIGDKTMIDALQPAVEAFEAAEDFTDAWREAAAAAERGADSTAPLVARQGRAKYLGERGIGHVDPGAATIAIMFSAARDYWESHS